LCKAIVWTDSRTKNVVTHFEHKLEQVGIQVSPGVWKKGQEGIDVLRDMWVPGFLPTWLDIIPDMNVIFSRSTGLPLSTYFSAIKLRWMVDHYPEVGKAHEADDLLFGTVESWVAYVRKTSGCCHTTALLTTFFDRIYLVEPKLAFISAKLVMHRAHYSLTPRLCDGNPACSNSSVFTSRSYPDWYQLPRCTEILYLVL